ncbi:hypothetical protein [Bizionia arctica]|uniref:Uncharacterized protein n=1 Tax=Bizionia arctica TaxID=1495645 RepID=A0A917GXP6_9FLAO|nr:hypothetical protein [Bizionia arctica]GGG60693.1 hypothetical protein GCM10010976_34280 [Bizionia arctica]
MKKYLTLILFCFLVYSCGCEDRGAIDINVEFTEFESTIISSELNQENEFTNQNSEILNAQYSEFDSEPKVIPLNRDDCSVTFLDSTTIKMSFINEGIILTIAIEKNEQSLTSFVIFVNNDRFLLNTTEFEQNISEQQLTDYNSNGFTFNDIFNFEGISEFGINKIIYSIDNGIEFIEYENGNYLKLTE